MALTDKYRRLGMWRALGAALVLGMTLPMAAAPALACVVWTPTTIESELRADAAFVGEVTSFEIVTNNGFDRYRYGILKVRVIRPIYGDIKNDAEIFLYLDNDFTEGQKEDPNYNNQMMMNKNIFFVNSVDTVNEPFSDETSPPDSEIYKYRLKFRGFGEPTFEWWKTNIGSNCGSNGIHAYSPELEQEIRRLKQTLNDAEISELLSRDDSSQTVIFEFPIDPSVDFVKPTYRQEYSFYVMVGTLVLGIPAIALFLIRRRRKRKST